MYNQYRKLDPYRILKLKRQGLSNTQIAQRFGVTSGAVYSVLRKAKEALNKSARDEFAESFPNDGNLKIRFTALDSSVSKRILDA